jgi:hypothetical protein
MGGEKSREVVRTVRVRGRIFQIVRINWTDTDGLSFDVMDGATGLCLTSASFDYEPGVLDIAELLNWLGGELRMASDPYWDGEEERALLAVVLAATTADDATDWEQLFRWWLSGQAKLGYKDLPEQMRPAGVGDTPAQPTTTTTVNETGADMHVRILGAGVRLDSNANNPYADRELIMVHRQHQADGAWVMDLGTVSLLGDLINNVLIGREDVPTAYGLDMHGELRRLAVDLHHEAAEGRELVTAQITVHFPDGATASTYRLYTPAQIGGYLGHQ